jgi:hypothetical protein
VHVEDLAPAVQLQRLDLREYYNQKLQEIGVKGQGISGAIHLPLLAANSLYHTKVLLCGN